MYSKDSNLHMGEIWKKFEKRPRKFCILRFRFYQWPFLRRLVLTKRVTDPRVPSSVWYNLFFFSILSRTSGYMHFADFYLKKSSGLLCIFSLFSPIFSKKFTIKQLETLSSILFNITTHLTSFCGKYEEVRTSLCNLDVLFGKIQFLDHQEM